MVKASKESPVSGAESDNGTLSFRRAVVLLLLDRFVAVDAFGVVGSVNVLADNGVSSSMTETGDDAAVGVTVGSLDGVDSGASVEGSINLLVGVIVVAAVGVLIDVVSGVWDGDTTGVFVVCWVGLIFAIGVGVISGVAVCFGVTDTSGTFWEIICHSPRLLTIVSHTSHPSPVTSILTYALGAIIVAHIPSEAICRFVTLGRFQITVCAVFSFVLSDTTV